MQWKSSPTSGRLWLYLRKCKSRSLLCNVVENGHDKSAKRHQGSSAGTKGTSKENTTTKSVLIDVELRREGTLKLKTFL